MPVPTYSASDKAAIEAVTVASAALGLLGALLTIGTIAMLKNHRVFAFRLVLYLSISEAGASLVSLTGRASSDESFCQFQSIAHSFFTLASVLWVDVIAFVLYRSVVQQTAGQKRKELLYIGVVVACSLLLALLPLLTDSYAESATGFCWLSERRYAGLIWQLLQFYLPLWISMGGVGWCYYCMYLQSICRPGLIVKTLSRLKHYPLVLVCFLFATVNRIYLFGNSPSVVLACLDSGFANLVGLASCAIYSSNSQVKQACRARLRACWAKPELQLIDGNDSG